MSKPKTRQATDFEKEAFKQAINTARDRRLAGHSLSDGGALILDPTNGLSAAICVKAMMGVGRSEQEAKKELAAIVAEAKVAGTVAFMSMWFDNEYLRINLVGMGLPQSDVDNWLQTPLQSENYFRLAIASGTKMSLATAKCPPAN